MKKWTPWTRDLAFDFIARAIPVMKDAGYACALAGSLLIKNESQKDLDLDLVLFPYDNTKSRVDDALEALRSLGMACVFDVAFVHEKWANQGSTDRKHVEVWEYDGHRIDVFWLE
jgi:hypothetical protein